MKICFVGINAKYIHTNPAIRILNKIVEKEYDSTFLEFTIKDSIDNILESLSLYDMVGISCYIWNIEFVKVLAEKFKEKYPDKVLFAGGPEVSYEPETFIDYFDYIMCGEGEDIVLPFIKYIAGSGILPDGIATKQKTKVDPVFVETLSKIPEILDTYSDLDRSTRVIYCETNRGCPFNCSYCLSSCEGDIRYFSDEQNQKTLSFIKNNKFKCIKFLDRSFNVNPKRFLSICKYLEDSPNIYQFEIEAQLLNEEVVYYFTKDVKKGKFRLEIGIQTLNQQSLLAVNRHQDSSKILEIIKRINDAGKCVIHTDLIAGLPYENLDSFKNTFNEVFKLETEELQLGFLKMLRGTKIRNEAGLFNYKFSSTAPYEVLSNAFMTEEDIKEIHDCENALEWIWNDKRAINLMKHIIKDNIVDNYFDFFKNFNTYLLKHIQLQDRYKDLVEYIISLGIYKEEYLYDIKLDYLSFYKIKPIKFWAAHEQNTPSYKDLDLSNEYKNAFITRYYQKYLVIKYTTDGPLMEFLDIK